MVIADDLSTDAKRGLLLSTGILVTPRYQRVNDNVTVYCGVINGPPKGQYFAIDKKTGKETLLPYDEVLFFQHGLAAVKSGDKYGFVDETGKPVIPLKKLNYAYGFVTKNFGAVTDKKREDICIDNRKAG